MPIFQTLAMTFSATAQRDRATRTPPRSTPPRRGRYLVAIALAASVAVAQRTAHAEAPLAGTHAQGWYRTTLGDFEVTALSDGTAQLPVQDLLTHTTPEKVHAALATAFLKSPVDTSINGFLINTGTKLVLIDCGAGALFGPTVGKLTAALKAAGYTPEQVDEIYITHLHIDHIGALIANGKIAFPRAIVRAGKADAAFWLSPENLERAPDAMKDFFKGAQAMIRPYIAAGRFKPIEAEGELVPGIKAIPNPGHTPGHTIYRVSSRGATLMVWGDMLHVAAVQFPDPSVTIEFDVNAKAAAAQRAKAFADAAKAGYFVAIAHVAFPGIGQLRSEGTGYRFYPINYVNSAPLAAR